MDVRIRPAIILDAQEPLAAEPVAWSDWALLAAFLLTAALGTWTNCLLLNDGAVILSSGFLGNSWDLYISQIASRAGSVLSMVGPAWLLQTAFDLGPRLYMIVAHLLYFAVPLLIWLVLRAVERDRVFSRLYLALMLVLVYFPTELIFGIGLWLIWLTLLEDPAPPRSAKALVTLLLGAAMAATHPALGLMGFAFVATGLLLRLFGRHLPAFRLPDRILITVGLLSAALLALYFVMSNLAPPTNLTALAAHGSGRYDYVNPFWMLKSIALFPVLGALWFLLLVPGAGALRLQGRYLAPLTLVIAVAGVWFAVAGTTLQTSAFARHTGPYVLAVALVLALPDRAAWLRRAERPLILFALIAAASAVSENVDLHLFGRHLERQQTHGVADAVTVKEPWPSARPEPAAARILFKYGARGDYVRDSVMPTYDWYRIMLAFYSFFRSDGQGVLFHPVSSGTSWVPYECPAVGRARNPADDERDRLFKDFLEQHYCVQ
jgi:hypothetical protein